MTATPESEAIAIWEHWHECHPESEAPRTAETKELFALARRLEAERDALREALIEVDRQSFRIAWVASNVPEWQDDINAALVGARAALSSGGEK